MFQIKVLIVILLLIISLNYFLNKSKFLVDEKYSNHKSFVSSDITPLSGGIIFLISILIFLSFENFYTKILLIFIFIIGLLSDLNYLVSPIKRIFYQISIILAFIYFNDIYVESIRILIIDQLLENLFFKVIFTSFCFLVLLNGSNFIDGLNTILIGYYFILSVICILLVLKFDLPISDYQNFLIIILTLGMLLIFNFFGKLYSGDGGAYLISFIVGMFLVNLANVSKQISPYFVACLLWYPAYENLFSIFRKKILKKSVINPDNRHLHHLIFLYFKKNIKSNNLFLNSISGIIINLFNLLIFYNAYHNISQTKNLVCLILISIFIYSFTYWRLNKLFKIY